MDRDETQVGGDLVAVLDRNQVTLFIIKFLNSSRKQKKTYDDEGREADLLDLAVASDGGDGGEHLLDRRHDAGAAPVLVRGEDGLDHDDNDEENGQGKVG